MTDLTGRSVADIRAKFAAEMAVVPGKRVRFDFGSEGSILLDGIANRVSDDEGPADAVLVLSFADFRRLAEGRLGGTWAVLTGRMKIKGDPATALQLQSVMARIKD